MASLTVKYETEKLFGMAANHMITVKGLSLSSDQRLELYSLFKQATEGDCNEAKPSLIDLVGRAKWGAWNARRGGDPLEAMAAYIVRVTDLCPDWLQQAQGQPPPEGDGMMGEDEMKKDLAWEGGDKEEDDNGAGLGYGVTVSTMAAGQGNTQDWGANEEIFAAASNGDLQRLDNLVSRGAEIDATDDIRQSGFFESNIPSHAFFVFNKNNHIRRGYPYYGLFGFPVEGGASSTPATEAVLLGSSGEKQNTLGSNVELRRRNFPDDVPESDDEGRTPLHFAADRGQPAVVSRLLELGAVVDARDADGMTPLAYAVACEHEKEIMLLVQAGADVNCADDDGSSPLSAAEESIRHLLLRPALTPT